MPEQHSNEKAPSRRDLRFAGEIPDVIKNVRRERTYHKGKLLGKGGFARCYELIEQATGRSYAGKAILLKSLSKKRYSEKLALEIKIHGSLVHQYICRLYSTFHDTVAYYLIMELCSGGTLADLIKARGCLTEPEARYFMRQLLLAMAHMRDKGIIHRDLKPANVFLSESLEVKVGDFGLATIMHTETERHTSMCGTPNYIAPEILATHIYNRFIRIGSCIPPDEQYIDSETVALARKKDEGLKRGHFYPIDVWCAGNIMYCMLYGKAAFECGSIKETYKKVLTCMTSLEFPPARGISRDAEKLIRQMLNENPLLRPTPEDVLESDWMQGYIPQVSQETLKTMPSYASSRDRDYAEMLGGVGTHASFERSFGARDKGKDNRQDAMSDQSSTSSTESEKRGVAPNRRAANGKDFDKKDNAPLNFDASSKRAALELKSNTPCAPQQYTGDGNAKLELGTLQTPVESRANSRNKVAGSDFVKGYTQFDNDFTSTATSPSAKVTQSASKKTATSEQPLGVIDDNMEALAHRTRSVIHLRPRSKASTGALPVVNNSNNNSNTDQLVPISERETGNFYKHSSAGVRDSRHALQGTPKRELVTNDKTSTEGAPRTQSVGRNGMGKRQQSEGKFMQGGRASTKVELPSLSSGGQREIEMQQHHRQSRSSIGLQPNKVDEKQGLDSPTTKYTPPTLQPKTAGQATSRADETPLHVIAWVDYSNRFGFGCQLSDGTVAVAFNDGTSASVSPLGTVFEIQSIVSTDIATLSSNDGISRYSFKNTPRQVREKAGLLKYFQEYLESRILVPVPTEARPPDPSIGIHLVQLIQWRHFGGDLLVRLNDGTVQCNFSDHTKLILNKVTVSLIDESREIFTYLLVDITSQSGARVGKIVERISRLRSYMKKITEDAS